MIPIISKQTEMIYNRSFFNPTYSDNINIILDNGQSSFGSIPAMWFQHIMNITENVCPGFTHTYQMWPLQTKNHLYKKNTKHIHVFLWGQFMFLILWSEAGHIVLDNIQVDSGSSDHFASAYKWSSSCSTYKMCLGTNGIIFKGKSW